MNQLCATWLSLFILILGTALYLRLAIYEAKKEILAAIQGEEEEDDDA